MRRPRPVPRERHGAVAEDGSYAAFCVELLHDVYAAAAARFLVEFEFVLILNLKKKFDAFEKSDYESHENCEEEVCDDDSRYCEEE